MRGIMHRTAVLTRALTVLGALVAMGCAGGIEVKTAVAPDADFSGARTFRFLPYNATNATNPAASNDPMLENTITGKEVRHDIARALTERGYQRGQGTTDLSVAFYIGSKNQLQVTDYDYGYRFWGWRGWRWGHPWGAWPEQQVTEFEQGTIVIDVLDSGGQKLLWRGVGKSEVPDDPNDYAKALAQTVKAIMDHFPAHVAH
jgi:hypothetical protein